MPTPSSTARLRRVAAPVRLLGGQPRHPGDILRVSLGLVLLVVGVALVFRSGVSTLEKDLFRLVNDLPHALTPVFAAARWLGSLWALPVIAGIAAGARRLRLAVDMLVSGLAGWLVAFALADVVDRARPAEVLERVVDHGADVGGSGFPSASVALAAALATAAGPSLPRPLRRAAWVLVALVAIARLHAGAELPLDVAGGAVVGWVAGAAWHLVAGAPGARPTVAQVRAALRSAGLEPVEVRPASVDARGSTPFFATSLDGRELFVKVVGREERDADLLFKTWRFLAFRELEDEEPFPSAKRQVEHEAYLALLAERAGVRTPSIVTTVDAGDGVHRTGAGFVLVQARIPGRTLDSLGAEVVDDGLLRRIWDQVGRLHRARLAHRDLRLANVLVADDGQPWLIDFGFAEATASDRRRARDVAELLASLACAIGSPRAVASAVDVLGRQPVAAAAPLLQPLALSAATRHDLRARQGLLGTLRQAVAEQTGAEAVELERLTRVKPSTVFLVLGAGFAIHLLLPQVGELDQTLDALRSARWGWLALGLVLSGVTYLMAGLALLGAVAAPLALGRTAAVQLASSFTNRLTPGNLGGVGVNIRFLEHAGLDRAQAVGAVALDTAAGAVVHLGAMVVALSLVGRRGVGDLHLPTGWHALVAVVVVLVLTGVALGTRLGRRRLVRPGVRAGRDLAAVLARPAKALQLFGGSVGVTAGYALALAASLEAFGAGAPLTKVVAVYLGAAALASVSPTPGGLGAMEAALVAGLTALGTRSGPAIAGVLSFRLVTYWLPVVPGWVTYRLLISRGVI